MAKCWQVGNIVYEEGVECIVEALDDMINEDWKTALARNQPVMPRGMKGRVKRVIQNFYGTFLEVLADDGHLRYLKGDKLTKIQ